MNWLEHARREIQENARRPTAVTAEGNPSTVTAVLPYGPLSAPSTSFGSNGSAPPKYILDSEDMRAAFEERAAIMEFDGGLSRDEAERAAWALMVKKHSQH